MHTEKLYIKFCFESSSSLLEDFSYYLEENVLHKNKSKIWSFWNITYLEKSAKYLHFSYLTVYTFKDLLVKRSHCAREALCAVFWDKLNPGLGSGRDLLRVGVLEGGGAEVENPNNRLRGEGGKCAPRTNPIFSLSLLGRTHTLRRQTYQAHISPILYTNRSVLETGRHMNILGRIGLLEKNLNILKIK